MGINKKRVYLRLSGMAVSLLLAGWLLFTSVDTVPYKETSFYGSTLSRLDSIGQVLNQQTSYSPVEAGWGTVNITPPEPVRMTGKNFKPYVDVADSIYLRTILFSNAQRNVVLLSYDLWFIHHAFAKVIREEIRQHFPEITGVYFTANHTHTSIGGWATGILGTAVVGGNNPETVAFLADQTIESIRQAKQRLSPVMSGYGEVSTVELVANRLNEEGRLDDKLRTLKLTNSRNQTGVFNTFSAHSVYMDEDLNTLSSDYPGPFLDYIKEAAQLDFASFSPGATGSHTPANRNSSSRNSMLNYSSTLAGYFQSLQTAIIVDTTEILKYLELPVDLRTPHFRVTNNIRFRPWVFNTVMGVNKGSITALRVGNTVLVGLPVELSGEYYHLFDKICTQRGLALMITSFNGDYLGYVNPEEYYYTIRHAETRDLNWFGPQNGEYFVELVNRILAII